MGKLRELENKRNYYRQRAEDLSAEIDKLKKPDDIDDAHLKMLLRGHRWPTKEMMKLASHNPILDKVFAVLSFAWDRSSVFDSSARLAERLPREQRFFPVAAEKTAENGFKFCPWPRPARHRILVELPAVHVGPLVWTTPGDYRAGAALAHKYLEAICRAGIWHDMERFAGQRREGRGKIFCIGYWSTFGGLHRVPFLKDSPEWHKRLRRMTLQPGKKANYNGGCPEALDFIEEPGSIIVRVLGHYS